MAEAQTITNLGGDRFPVELTFEQALSFLSRRGNIFYRGVEENEKQGFFCTGHNKTHEFGFWNMMVGNYVGLDSEAEVIEWVKQLIPNSI